MTTIVGAVAVATLAVPATADAGRMIERDFTATYTGVYQDEADVTHTCDESETANLVLGEGIGRGIGRFDLRIEACVAPTSPVTGTVEGTAFYVAANGDELNFEFAGDYEVNLATGVVEAELPATGTSGTGRFANVELGDTPGAAFDNRPLGTNLSFGEVAGSLVYDASNRAMKG